MEIMWSSSTNVCIASCMCMSFAGSKFVPPVGLHSRTGQFLQPFQPRMGGLGIAPPGSAQLPPDHAPFVAVCRKRTLLSLLLLSCFRIDDGTMGSETRAQRRCGVGRPSHSAGPSHSRGSGGVGKQREMDPPSADGDNGGRRWQAQEWNALASIRKRDHSCSVE